MPTVADVPPPAAALIEYGPQFEQEQQLGCGETATRLREHMLEVIEHWLLRAGAVVQIPAASDTLGFEHVRLRPLATTRIIYRLQGRLRPRRFDEDE